MTLKHRNFWVHLYLAIYRRVPTEAEVRQFFQELAEKLADEVHG